MQKKKYILLFFWILTFPNKNTKVLGKKNHLKGSKKKKKVNQININVLYAIKTS